MHISVFSEDIRDIIHYPLSGNFLKYDINFHCILQSMHYKQ